MMTFGGVPILDWVLLVVLLGFGVEAYVTTRNREEDAPKADGQKAAAEPPAEASQTRVRDDADR